MKFGVTFANELSTQLLFENGWAIGITRLHCGHIEYCIAPRFNIENEEFGISEFLRDPEHWNADAMKARGDLDMHFKGTDDELLAIILAVRLRPQEAGLAKVSQDIIKAVKS